MMDLVVLGLWLNSIILKVFSNLDYSMSQTETFIRDKWPPLTSVT